MILLELLRHVGAYVAAAIAAVLAYVGLRARWRHEGAEEVEAKASEERARTAGEIARDAEARARKDMERRAELAELERTIDLDKERNLELEPSEDEAQALLDEAKKP